MPDGASVILNDFVLPCGSLLKSVVTAEGWQLFFSLGLATIAGFSVSATSLTRIFHQT
jgi:hypothetical protein